MKNYKEAQDFREKYYVIRYERISGDVRLCSILAHTPKKAKKTFRYGHKNVKIISIELETKK